MDKNAILAVMISLAIWVGWQKFYLEPIQKKSIQQIDKVAKEGNNSLEKNIVATETLKNSNRVLTKGKKLEINTLDLDLEETKIRVSNANNILEDWTLNHYSTDINEKEKKVTLSWTSGFGKQLEIRFSDQSLNEALISNWQSIQNSQNKIVQKLDTSLFSIEREFSPLSQNFSGELKYKFRFLKNAPKYVFLDFYGSPQRANDHDGSIFGQTPDKVHITYLSLVDRKQTMATSLDKTIESMSGVKWMGIDTRYFVFGLVPDASIRDKLGVQIEKEVFQEQNAARGSIVIPTNDKQEVSFSTKVYFGPKKFEYLEAVDPVLVDTIDFGLSLIHI